MGYKVYTTVIDKVIRSQEDFDVTECSVDFEVTEMGPLGAVTEIKLTSLVGGNTSVFEVHHPLSYTITDDNWADYLAFLLSFSITHNIKLQSGRGDNTKSAKIAVEKVLDRIVIESTNNDETFITVIESDVMTYPITRQKLKDSLVVVDHEFGDLVDMFSYEVDLYKIHVIPMKDGLPVLDLPSYHLPFGADQATDITKYIISLYLSPQISLTLHPYKEGEYPLPKDLERLEKKFIGNVGYLESNDRKITVVPTYDRMLPINAQVAVIEKIENSILNLEEQQTAKDLFYQYIRKASRDQSNAYLAILRACIKANETIDRMIEQ